MPAWIHERAKHLLASNPDMKKSTAFALATQQSHTVGKTPKGYGTSEGRQEAKAKFDKPKKEYVKSPNPGGLKTEKLPGKAKTEWTGKHLVEKKAMVSMREELEKQALSEPLKRALEAGKAEVGPAAGAVLGAAGAGYLGVNPLAGAAAGYGLGALPEIVHALRTRKVKLGGLELPSAKLATPSPYMLDKIHVEPKVRPLRADAPEPKHRVKQAEQVGVFGMPIQGVAGSGMTSAKQLEQSQKIGVPRIEQPKVQTMGVKMAFLLEGFRPDPAWLDGFAAAGKRNAATLAGMRKAAFQVSQFSGTLGESVGDIYTPSSHKYAGPAPEEGKKRTKAKAMTDEIAKLNGVATTPAGRLYSAQQVGQPKVTAPSGPSIAELSKPVGYGLKAPGATKDTI